MKTANLKHKMKIHAKPGEVYKALMDSKSHTKITGMAAQNSSKAGGYFVQCNTHHYGYNLLLQPGKRIIQSWCNKDFPNGHHSIVDWKFEKTEDGTLVSFHQYAVPKDAVSWLESGWKKIYFEPLKAYFEQKETKAKKTATPLKKSAATKKVSAKKAATVKKVAVKKVSAAKKTAPAAK